MATEGRKRLRDSARLAPEFGQLAPNPPEGLTDIADGRQCKIEVDAQQPLDADHGGDKDRLRNGSLGEDDRVRRAYCQLRSLAGQEHGRTIRLADIRTFEFELRPSSVALRPIENRCLNARRSPPHGFSSADQNIVLLFQPSSESAG
jgi:hypothetical protein